MKKNTSFLMLAIAACIALTSCSKKENEAEKLEIARKEALAAAPTNIKVKLKVLGANQAYAEEGTAINEVPKLNDFTLYFIASNVIGKPIVKIEKGTVASSSAQIVNNVPSSADQVYVIANAVSTNAIIPQNFTPSTLDDLDNIKFNVAEQGNFIDNVNLEGDGKITAGSNGDLEANINIKPSVARIEIDKISAKIGSPNELSDFKLSGIFINKTYTKFSALKNTTVAMDVDYSNLSDFDAQGNFATNNNTFCDVFSTPQAAKKNTTTNALECIPSSINYKTWAYYVAPAATPSIILKIEGAMEKNQSNGVNYGTAPQFITITQFIDNNTNQPLSKFESGKVYHITNIEVDGNNLVNQPNSPSVKVTAKVTISPWIEAATGVIL